MLVSFALAENFGINIFFKITLVLRLPNHSGSCTFATNFTHFVVRVVWFGKCIPNDQITNQGVVRSFSSLLKGHAGFPDRLIPCVLEMVVAGLQANARIDPEPCYKIILNLCLLWISYNRYILRNKAMYLNINKSGLSRGPVWLIWTGQQCGCTWPASGTLTELTHLIYQWA